MFPIHLVIHNDYKYGRGVWTRGSCKHITLASLGLDTWVVVSVWTIELV